MSHMHRCKLCQSEDIEKIHSGTRGNSDVDVLRCKNCRLVFLSTFEHLKDDFYEDGGMRENTAVTDMGVAVDKTDTLRRITALSGYYDGKDILDFGCGRGSFITLAKNYAKSVSGVEIEKSVVSELREKGFQIENNIRNFNKKFDLITMFHVIEHFIDPVEWLKEISSHLTGDGYIIIETPNANDALLSLYGCSDFADFTYWHCHTFLFTSETLQQTAEKAGLEIVWNRQIQRYSPANHMYWLSKGKPGGHNVWSMLDGDVLTKEYENMLQKNKICDTLFMCAKLK